MTEEQRHALNLAEAIAETIASGADAATLGPTDAALAAKALQAWALTEAMKRPRPSDTSNR